MIVVGGKLNNKWALFTRQYLFSPTDKQKLKIQCGLQMETKAGFYTVCYNLAHHHGKIS